MESINAEERIRVIFEQRDRFRSLLHGFLSLDTAVEPDSEAAREEIATLSSLTGIVRAFVCSVNSSIRLLTPPYTKLDLYQEQVYLLDPYLDELVSPLLQTFQTHFNKFSSASAIPITSRIRRVSHLVYYFTKVRGAKTIVRFFPHQAHDLSLLLEIFRKDQAQSDNPDNWEFRYALLLWLSLVCMIPFDMSKFDSTTPPTTSNGGDDETIASSSSAADQVRSLAQNALSSPGIERNAAAHLLGRFLLRRDTIEQLPGFLSKIKEDLQHTSDPFYATGVAQTLCQITKFASLQIISSYIPTLYELLIFYQPTVAAHEKRSVTARKYGVKLAGRLALLLLPPLSTDRVPLRRGRVRKQLGGAPVNPPRSTSSVDDDIDIPDQVQAIVADLLESLQDKDTSVRWLSAKYLGRIAERLQTSFSSQLVDAILDLFARDITRKPKTSLSDIDKEGKEEEDNGDSLDLSTVDENAWQGACLGIAELCRRGVLMVEKLNNVVEWVIKALSFDQLRRKKAVGTSIRDSAAYVVWAMARSFEADELQSFIIPLAENLLVTAMYDREIHIRRAASAAFQELVGRQGTVPHGIDILRRIDFITVSIRRKAFIDASNEIAKFEEYRHALLNRLQQITTKHWDFEVRKYGSIALAIISSHLSESSYKSVLQMMGKRVLDRDISSRHGAIVSLGSLVGNMSAHNEWAVVSRSKTMRYANELKVSDTTGSQGTMIMISMCEFLNDSIDKVSVRELGSLNNLWAFIESAMTKQNDEYQKLAGSIVGKITTALVESDENSEIYTRVDTLLKKCIASLEARGRSATGIKAKNAQSFSSIVLGNVNWSAAHPWRNKYMEKGLNAILSTVKEDNKQNNRRQEDNVVEVNDRTASSKNSLFGVDIRKNAFGCLGSFFRNMINDDYENNRNEFEENCLMIWSIFLDGLDDYTTDQRGDVGSWIRNECIKQVVEMCLLFSELPRAAEFGGKVGKELCWETVGKLLRLSVEMMDSVRFSAMKSLLQLVKMRDFIYIKGKLMIFKQLEEEFDAVDDGTNILKFREISWTLGKIMKILEDDEGMCYMQMVLPGMVEPVGGAVETAAAPMAFIHHLNALNDLDDGKKKFWEWIESLITLLKSNGTSKTRRIFICTLKTLVVCLESKIGKQELQLCRDTDVGKDMFNGKYMLLQMVKNVREWVKSRQRGEMMLEIVLMMYNGGFREDATKALISLSKHPISQIREITNDMMSERNITVSL